MIQTKSRVYCPSVALAFIRVHVLLEWTRLRHDWILCEILGSDGGESEDDNLLGLAPCRLEVDRRFRNMYSDEYPDNGAVRTSETLVCFNEITWRYIPEGLHIQRNFIYMTMCDVSGLY
jgi:hypothetical protein